MAHEIRGRPDGVCSVVLDCSIQDIEIALPASLSCRLRWRAVPIDRRVAVMTAAAALMRRRRFELAAWEIFETGKPWREADAGRGRGDRLPGILCSGHATHPPASPIGA